MLVRKETLIPGVFPHLRKSLHFSFLVPPQSGDSSGSMLTFYLPVLGTLLCVRDLARDCPVVYQCTSVYQMDFLFFCILLLFPDSRAIPRTMSPSRIHSGPFMWVWQTLGSLTLGSW